MSLKKRFLISLMALPFVVTILVSALIVNFQGNFRPVLEFSGSARLVIAFVSSIILLCGVILFIWSNFLFIKMGRGTLAPWDPPHRLVIEGPYGHVRNPMIIGVMLILLAEPMFFLSAGMLIWCFLFAATNMVYFPLVEEKMLLRRFGERYEAYRKNVPAWFPRLTAWEGD